MRAPTDVVKGLWQTEKSARVAPHDQYCLRVALDANKVEVRQAVEELFKVTVRKVNTQVYEGKWRRLSARGGRRPDWKKAFVTLAKNQKIEANT